MGRVGGIWLAFCALLPGWALAHAALQNALPPEGSRMEAAPAAVTLTFSEALEPRFSSVVVSDAAGARVDRGDLKVAPGDGRTVRETLGLLLPGHYRVTWKVVSIDTHKSQGHYSFTIEK